MSGWLKQTRSESVDQANDLQERLDFLKLDQRDSDRLRETAPVFEAVADQFVEEFYNHLFAFDETARFLKDSTLVERLKRSQKEHFRTMFRARWDNDYLQHRRQVGQVHAEIGIEPQFFLGAYNQFLSFALSRLYRVGETISQEGTERMRSLLKGVFLDVGLSLDAYFRRSTEDLQRALDLVWQANKELKQFAQFTSHDLKTPLGTMANLCEEALDEFGGQIPAEARALIESARQTAFRMSSMIDELLSLSIPSDEDMAEEPAAMDTVLSEALDRVRPELKRRNIEVTLPSQTCRIVGRKAPLREAFYSLFSNAAKYIERNPGRIVVGMRIVDGRCIISVADNGPGIPPDELERIFVPFRRLPMHRNKAGSGLGLYFTKNLIEQQEGRIWVESRMGEGSCFFVSLKHAADGPSKDRAAHDP